MIKIVFVITGLSTGGAEAMLLKLLQNLDRSRFTPMVVSLTDEGQIGPRIRSLAVPVQALGMRQGRAGPLSLLRLARLLRRYRPDLVHTWMYHADLLGGLAARMAGCRKILWCIRNSDLSVERTGRSTRAVVKLCAWLSSRVPDAILSCSHRAVEIHVAAGYRKDKFHVIPNGFDLARFRPDSCARESMRAEIGLPLDTPLAGMIGRFDPQKNHKGFVLAAAAMAVRHPRVHFVLAGAGVTAENAELRSAISAHPGLMKRMHLLGLREDLPRLMSALDVLASSSSYGEAFPNVLGEAMACGVPCVVTDVGDSAAIVDETGRAVPVGDMEALAQKVVELLELSAGDRQGLGDNARARVQQCYEIGHVVRLYEELYEMILGRPKATRLQWGE